MKSLVRLFLFNALAIWLVGQFLPQAVTFDKGYETMAFTVVVLAIVNLFIKPIINILLLPINLVTMGTLRWLVNVGSLFLVTLIVPDFKVHPFTIPSFTFQGVIIPTINLNQILAFIAISFAISIIVSVLHWISK